MKVTILKAGYCTCPEHIAIQKGAWRRIRFPAMVALLEHERFGPMLYDTGYSERFFAETRAWHSRPYRWLTPVTLQEDELIVNQLDRRGLRPNDIRAIFISHFHADHIAALRDFKSARFWYLHGAYEGLSRLHGLGATLKAFLPGLLPQDFPERAAPLKESALTAMSANYAPFERGHDVLGDGSLLAVDLPGHAAGQMGLLARADDREYFFVADSAWLMRSIREDRPPHPLASVIVQDPVAYRGTLRQLHDFQMSRPDVQIVPSHCEETLDQVCA